MSRQQGGEWDGVMLMLMLALVNGGAKITTVCGANSTYSLVPTGERIRWREYAARAAVFTAAMIASGAASGFLYTTVIFLIATWLPDVIKISILLALALMYLLRELGLLSLPLPQIRWQIPVYWVNRSPLQNSLVWGTVLGPGIFTYNPHFTFYIYYLYIGFFYSPPMGILGGAIYGLGRCLPSLLLAARRNRKPELLVEHRWTAWSSRLHVLILILTMAYAGYLLVQSLQS